MRGTAPSHRDTPVTSDPSHPPNSPRQLEPGVDSPAEQQVIGVEQPVSVTEQPADAQVTTGTLGGLDETPSDVSLPGEVGSLALLGTDVAAVGASASLGDDAGVGEPASDKWLTGTSRKELTLINHRLRQTLVLQGVVASVVFGFWLLGKLSWNHDPLVSQRFRRAEVNVLSNRAQNAALQFHHDLTTGQFGQARLLATEGAESLVDEAVAACQPSAPCSSKARVFTRATLLRSLGQEAHTRVESFTKDGTLVSAATYEVSHASGQWLVAGRNAL